MQWKVEHGCPQCGAPVEFEETDRLFACPYCRVRLFMHTPTCFRYCLPAKDPDREDVLYVPYWRFRGTVFSCVLPAVKHRLLDATMIAYRKHFLPLSLGLRPQVMKLSFAYTRKSGKFLVPDQDLKTSVEFMEKRLRAAGADVSRSSFHREYIGEQASLIYAPVYEKHSMLHDGVLDKPLQKSYSRPFSVEKEDDPKKWKVRFIPTLCPGCGWDLKGPRDSLVLVCTNCQRVWESGGDRFVAAKAEFAADPTNTCDLYLPFWNMTIKGENIRFSTFADLARAVNLPKVSRPSWEQEAITFLIPAFKIRPDLFLRLGKQLSISRFKVTPGSLSEHSDFFPITLSREEAIQGVKILFAHMITAKRKLFPKIKDIRLYTGKEKLLFIPFKEQGNELIQPGLRYGMSKKSVEYGRSL